MRTKWFIDNYTGYLIENNKKNGGDGASLKMLDVGGKNWNGNFDFFKAGIWRRTGIDIQDGEDVDIVPAKPYKWDEISDDIYDLTISSNAFQHIDFFWETIKEMHRVTVPGGLIYIIAPSNRYDGKYPYANWAFNKHGLIALADWADLEVVDCSVEGIPDREASEEWDHPLGDAVLIARKRDEKTRDKIDLPRATLSIERRFVH